MPASSRWPTKLIPKTKPQIRCLMKNSKMSMDIILVTFQREVLLLEVLTTLARAVAACPAIDYHLKIFINGADSKSLATAENFKKTMSMKVTVLHSDVCLSPAEARNKLVLNEAPASDWLFFIDDDISIPDSIFSSFCEIIKIHPSITVWGGPNITPLASTNTQKDIGWILNSWWVIGPVYQRYSWSGSIFKTGSHYNLMLCNLIVNTKNFANGPFQSFFRTAEENELLLRLKNLNIQFGFSDGLFVYHQRRSTWVPFLKQIFYYGYGRGQLLVYQRTSSQMVFFVYLCLMKIAIMALILFPMPGVFLLSLYCFFSYLIYVLRRRSLSLIPAAVCPLVPITYYFGILVGVLFDMVRVRRRKSAFFMTKTSQQ